MKVVDTMVLSLACMGMWSLLDFWAFLLTMVLLRVPPLLITLSLSFFLHQSMLLAGFLFVGFLLGFCLMRVALLRVLPMLVMLSLSFFLHQTMLLAHSLYFHPLMGFSLTSTELLQVLPLLVTLSTHMRLRRGIFLHLTALGGLPLKALRCYSLGKGFMAQTLMTKGVIWVPSLPALRGRACVILKLALLAHVDFLIVRGITDRCGVMEAVSFYSAGAPPAIVSAPAGAEIDTDSPNFTSDEALAVNTFSTAVEVTTPDRYAMPLR
ncbi:unnamed protein product, partial [Prorocentrum cordatum]